MKKIIYVLTIVAMIAVLAACGGKKESKGGEEVISNSATPETPAATDLVALGDALVKANDCKTCHHKENKLIGPAHLDVAKKYDFTKANVEMLAQKIIKGGAGVWGQIPMAAHASVSVGDAENMARYVLSLDGEKEH